MNKKVLLYSLIAVFGLGALGVASVSAAGFGFGQQATPEEIASRQTSMFERQASLLGVSVDVVKQGWAEGKTLPETATANGISLDTLQQKMTAEREVQRTNHLQTLVDQGVITKDQMSARLLVEANHTQTPRGQHRGLGGMGMGR